MDIKTSQRIGKIMFMIRYENPELVESIVDHVRNGKTFNEFPENIKNIVIEKEKKLKDNLGI